MVLRVYVEKRPGFDVEARQLAAELRQMLGIDGLSGVRLLNRYDVEGIDRALFEQCIPTVFSEPPVDQVRFQLPDAPNAALFAVEYLPGQFDQRADSAAECVQLVSQGERPLIATAKVYVLEGPLSADDVQRVKHYVINPIEAREAALDERATLASPQPSPAPVEVLDRFTGLATGALGAFIAERGLAMDLADALLCQRYFADEGRAPTITEIKMIDTYWSDHCRHTTFGTELVDVTIDDARARETWTEYLRIRSQLGRENKTQCLMDLGTLAARYLKDQGVLSNLDESDEINACTVKVTVDVDGTDENWLFLFKNETHNHPTEIEPFGGAATCVGGCIRDPLSGRSYVYQAMRVTGAADPLAPLSDTIPGKLPQRKLVTTAAAGYSSYGNQIGLATGQVSEVYHPGYAAKRMEIGAVVGAAPARNVRREQPAPGDVVILLGGRTGRDGIGGATGSSKAHDADSLEACGAEVQKGNAPVERKIQRLFRRGEATRLIKRCNDFGAGGVSVAVGELADGLRINLDLVPKKYDGLDGTELALSESQERMAVVVADADVDAFVALAHSENLEATPIAQVTEEPRVVMTWRGERIVDVSRAFLASNGAPKQARAHVTAPQAAPAAFAGATLRERLIAVARDLNVCSNKGLSERFDSTVGAGTVLMPFGGTHQLTPAQAMVAKFPVDGETTTTSGMAWGFNPLISSASPYDGAYLAVVESLARLLATGFQRTHAYLTLQEYFGSPRTDPQRWGKPLAALLGAFQAQIDLGVGAIGGKDSMSGSFEGLDVPPTLVSFAAATGTVKRAVSPEFKATESRVALLCPHLQGEGPLPRVESLVSCFDALEELMGAGAVRAASTPGYGCVAECLLKMCVGNRIGLALGDAVTMDDLFTYAYGAFVVELADGAALPEAEGFDVIDLGRTQTAYLLEGLDERIDLAEVQEAWEAALESVFPYRQQAEAVKRIDAPAFTPLTYPGTVASPRVIVPVFPGTNCEYDTLRAFRRAGADPHTLVVNNLSPAAIAESARELAARIRQSQIVMIPGGFSGGDEPDGSAKFITAFFRNPEVTEAVRDLLFNRDGLMLGICNGFQALVKLGLIPYGDIRPLDAGAPTLTSNTIGRHQSGLVRTRVCSTLSPWMSLCDQGDVHTVPISHGEGRFVASDDVLRALAEGGQIACQYVDAAGNPSMSWDVNPNGSVWAIEAVTSPDGRVLGKMAHTERTSAGAYRNVPNVVTAPLIEGGVNYFQ
ncbi:phosphoribosylformylglycinamidine synthase [Eggerthellaceae bacterium zg-1084]|uniref:phosphoribosylformylglycinamidine synthase n=1 Tax=Berryella wangjianweii TaxID=2734634 RepID=UPI001555EBD9|nr:phosphoribosylformylglycinamidine synthase [Berryella wangjianweii]NPD30884.1 phosphoribosylformylglycinamidine synthase [Berryella wangjianweii]